MGPKELAEAMYANKKFRDKTTGIVFVFISVDGQGNVAGFTEGGNFAVSHAKNLEVVESVKTNQPNTSEKIDGGTNFTI